MVEIGRKKVIFFLLFNNSDIAENVEISPAVRNFCKTERCLKQFMMDYFGAEGSTGGNWCSSSCDEARN